MSWKTYLEAQEANVGCELELRGRIDSLFGAGVVVVQLTVWQLTDGQTLLWCTPEDVSRLGVDPEGLRAARQRPSSR